MKKKRVFVGIKLGEGIRQEVKKIQDKLPEFIGKKTEIENLHLTLKFLGEVDEEKLDKVRESLRNLKFEKFEVSLVELGVFSEKFIRIVWLGVDKKNEDLWKLQEKIDERLKELFEEERRFMGHITIARVKKVENKKKFIEKINGIEIKKLKFDVNRFYLIESKLKPEGPEYKVIEEYRLD